MSKPLRDEENKLVITSRLLHSNNYQTLCNIQYVHNILCAIFHKPWF